MCFALGSLAYVNEAIPAPQVLVIAHVRELILQIGEVFTHLCRGVGFRSSQASTHPSSARTSDEVLNNTSFAQDIVNVTTMFRGLRLPVQLLLFSATFDDKVLRFTRKIAPGAVLIQKAPSELKLDTVHLVDPVPIVVMPSSQ